MKILQVVHAFPPKIRGGAELYAHNLSKELSKHHKVHVFYPTRNLGIAGYSLNKFRSNGLHITEIVNHQLPFPTLIALLNPKYMYKNRRIDRKFEVLLDEIDPDIVHFQHLINLSGSLIEVARQKGIPAVLTLHDYWFICPRILLLKNDSSICRGPDEQGENCSQCWNKGQAEFLADSLANYLIPKRVSRVFELELMAINRSKKFRDRNEYLKSLLAKVDKLIAPSRFLRNVFIEYGIPEDKITYSANGYDWRLFDGFKKKENDKLVFGFAGGVVKRKGVHVLVEAFNRVESSDVELRIYGSYDPHSNYFKELQAKTKKGNIKFMGRFEDPKEPYSEVDVLVVPSVWYETGGPLVILEAFLAKIPVIASNIGCMPEFVQDGETGLLFEMGNPDDLYEKIKIIIRNPGLIDRFRENIVAPRSIEDQARELERLYADLKQTINHVGNG